MPPFPFVFENFPENETNNSHILIVGDHFGKSLTNYQNEMTDELSIGLEKPLLIENWSQNGEGIHRTLKKIKSIKKLPKIIIYYGGSEEFYEEIVNPLYLDETLYNLKYFQKESIKTILSIVPELAPFFFKATPLVTLGKYISNKKTNIKDESHITLSEIKYILYEELLESLIRRIKSQNSTLIIVTPPINLDILPKKVCPQTTSDKIIQLQNYAFSLLQKEDFEGAQKELEPLIKIMPANPLSHYLLGKTYLGLSKIDEGLSHLEMAASLDCSGERGNLVFNGIQKKLALKYDLAVIDYHDFLKIKMFETITFLDDIFPQHLFNEELITKLIFPIKKYLKL